MPVSDPNSCDQCGTPLTYDFPISTCGQCLLKAAITDIHFDRKSKEGGEGMSGEEPTQRDRQSRPGRDEDLPDPEDLQRLFPELEIGRLLGAGGMGAVVQARQPMLKRDVAVKILSNKLAGDPEFIARFEREA